MDDAVPGQNAPGYTWYVKDWNNIFELNLDGLWHKDYIDSYEIVKPYYIDYFLTDYTNTGVSKNGKYCNATYVNENDAENFVYPYRFKCETFSSYIRIYKLKKSTDILDGWDIKSTYSLRIYVIGRIKYNYEDYSTTWKANYPTFKAYGFVNTGSYDDQNPNYGYISTGTS